MKHECGLCLRDNGLCKSDMSLYKLLFGKVKDCMIYDDYNKKILKSKERKLWRKKK